MKKYIKIEYDESMLGSDVTIITLESAGGSGFKVKKAYEGKLKDKVDWMVGCPIFECGLGVLGLDYECYLVKKLT
tara:strand:+ start:321 stop:545 length:225 start_codon:yes stop_codon:yes gene_type:complete